MRLRFDRFKQILLLVIIMINVMIPIDVFPEANETLEGYFNSNKIIRPTMIRAGESLGLLPAYKPVSLTVIDRQWGSMTLEDGKTGYIFYDGILPLPEYETVAEKKMYSETAMEILGVPLNEATAIAELAPMTLCIIDGVSGELAHIRLPESGISGYVDANLLKEAEFTPTSEPVTVTVIAAAPVKLTALPLYGSEIVGEIEAGCFFTAYEVGFSDHLLMREDNSVCYLPKNSVCVCYKNTLTHDKTEVLSTEDFLMPEQENLSETIVTRNDYLDKAFAMLEEKNSFLLRYNAITGAGIQSLFPQGVPYFWGGRSYNVLRELYPEYNTLAAWQSSPLYYRQGTLYLYGFDCVGFVKAVCSLAKRPVSRNFYELFAWEYCNDGYHIWCKSDHPMPEDWTCVAEKLEIGDILVVYHPGMHVMMYIGTLRDYGYTEKQIPYLADYLDYPLMIQCGEDPMCYIRFSQYINTSENERIQKATPPDGGVSICIIGVSVEDAEYIIRSPHMDYHCFFVEGSCVNLFDFDRVTDYIVYRP